MRSLSASIDKASMIVLLGMISCASVQPPVGIPEPAVIEGGVSIMGRHPYDRRLVLVGQSGDSWFLEAGAFEGELLGLEGQIIRAYGDLRKRSSGLQVLTVNRYELVPLSGQVAATGLLRTRAGVLLLSADPAAESGSAVEFVISGPLLEALSHFVGCRVWIKGEREVTEGERSDHGARVEARQDSSAEAEPDAALLGAGSAGVIVREYGVLGPAMSPGREARHSTGPDSCM